METLLIEPVWNRNADIPAQSLDVRVTFNRTSLE